MNQNKRWKVWVTREGISMRVGNGSGSGGLSMDDNAIRMLGQRKNEFDFEMIMDVMNELNRVRFESLSEGYCIETHNFHLTPHLSVKDPEGKQGFNRDRHRIVCTLRLTETLVKQLGDKEIDLQNMITPEAIILVVNNRTTDSRNNVIRPKDNIVVHGRKLRIAPEDDPRCGIFLLTREGVEYNLTSYVDVNEPRRLALHVPDLPSLQAGDWLQLEVRTRFLDDKTLLQEPRRIVFLDLMRVGNGKE